ncbi:LOW QUALITY PROTEIN: uncharacterized protein LOC108104370 [Drosophila eugracilis]|uniref:LOW QUALITY PROTEIN: uncharacterized protein LOC108104370 n=1 Tax=Drosophila eugracilis TaxID=29029 RepID=UPI0007E69585|nr:LOW QUALITY PROTEIN: uncharacterized protein LOC108104370 [Drosophila eugracilis]
MSSRKPPGGFGGADEATAAAAPLDDNANASVEIPVSSGEPTTGVVEELPAIIKTDTTTSPAHAIEELKATPDVDGEKDQDAKESNPGPKTPRSTPTPTLTRAVTPNATDGVAAKSMRVTRHSSPLLLLSSPTTSRREVGDGVLEAEEPPTGSGGQRKSSVERTMAPVIRGRKSIKDLKEAKEVKSEDVSAVASDLGAATATTPGQVSEGNELESLPATDKKDHKDIKDKEDDREKDKQKDIQENTEREKTAETETIAEKGKSAEKEKNIEKEKASDKEKEKEAEKEKSIESNKDTDKEKEKVKETVTPVLPIAPVATTSNRVTRKSHAQEQVINTRVTRNRRQSSTVGAIPSSSAALVTTSAPLSEQPPPARGRRKKTVAVAPPVEPAVKRKRSQDAEADSEATSTAKYSKVEVVKTESIEAPDEDSTTMDIKQEPVDASEVSSISPSITPTPTPTPAPAPISGGRRGRGRPQSKNSSSPATTTRATRLSKAGSPGILTPVTQEPVPPKRRKVGSNTRKTASASSLAPSSQGGAGDEDSKDSMASSMDDLLMAAVDIKQEKLTPDFDDSLLQESLPSTSGTSSANGHSCIEPLTVDTETIIKPACTEVKPKESPAATVEDSKSQSETQSAASSAAEGKAPSLSPEMISEGVSAVSVRKFYKKPEFLENNLGIEKDPELGEIVQTVSSNNTEANVKQHVDGPVNQEENFKPQIEVSHEKEEGQDEEHTFELERGKESVDRPETIGEDHSEILADVPVEIPAEITVKILPEAEGDSCSNSSVKAGELRLDESTDGPDPVLLLDDGLIVNGVEAPDQPEEKEDQVAFFHSEEYDDFEHEIMEELTKEGVLDASGNALSQKAEIEHTEDVTLPESKTDVDETLTAGDETVESDNFKDTSPADEMVAMEVDESYVDIKQQTDQLLAEHLVEEATDTVSSPEDNKENLSTSAASTATDGLDIQLALKEDDDEEKPLAVIAGTQKPDLLLAKEMKVDEKQNGKQETICDEQLQLQDNHQQNLRQEQEIHLQNLGLLTHQAAEQRRKFLLEAQARQAQLQHQQHHHNQHKRQGARGGGSATHVESSGTLKTVIKLNRSSNGGVGGSGGLPTGTVIHGGSGSSSASSTSSSSVGSATRKSSGALASGAGAGGGVRRQSLKMTFQKGRARGHGTTDRSADQYGAHAEDSYYTIQNENEGAKKFIVTSGNPGRKTNNRFSSTNNHASTVALHGNNSVVQYYSSHSESQGQADHGFYQMVKKDEKEKILIPEKASSFKFHPGRLCEDQCYYCSGKFGLYDTPCHVGQIKSVERQQKILANEEKLTVDNCLCDACFRHVDRRANAPSYKKRLSAPGHLETGVGGSAAAAALEHFAGDGGVIQEGTGEAGSTATGAVQHRPCAVKTCDEAAGHSLRRKCIRKSVKKFQLSLEIPAGSSIVWLCEVHYNTIIQFSGCVLCKRRLGKNHMYNITTQDTDRLEKALSEMGIPVQLGMGTAVCKLCRYFANLLMKPPDSTKSQKAEFVKNYRKRLLKVHNLQDGSHEVSEADEEEAPNVTEADNATTEGQEDAEMPMVVDFDGPTDSNSSNSSTAALDTSKQMSKLQAILQQNLGADAAGAAGAGAAAGTGAGGSGSGADISNVLRGNPNISMRELFHGEEELGVQFKVPFGCSSSQRTPEGWIRVQTFLQYDEPTRRLWEELQKPYGNQSSFLRHLILLEKYYRNGDLVLAPHASSNASVYTETVRQRLNSFDHGHCGGLGSTGSSSSGSNKRSGIPQPAGASVLATALTTPMSSHLSSTSISTEQLAPAEPVIPLVELNDDDEGENGSEGAGDGESNARQEESLLDSLGTVSVDKLTKQLSSNAVTIIARPKDKSQVSSNSGSATSISSSSSAVSSPEEVAVTKITAVAPAQSKDAPPLVPAGGNVGNSRSILKTNLLGMSKAVEIVPLAPASHTSTSTSSTAASKNFLTSIASLANKSTACHIPDKQQKILEVANKLLSSQGEPATTALLSLQTKLKPPMHQTQAAGSGAGTSGPQKPGVAQLLSSPPELISLHRRRTSGATTATNSLLGNLTGKRLQLPRTGAGPSAGAGTGTGAAGSRGAGGQPPPNVVILPDTLTAQERHESKSWKPTLIPLEDQHKVPNKSHALYQTADGRRLPALVQVQSGGKPYLISIFDYNRMCILRREKLLRDQMLKANAKQKTQNQQQQQGQTHQQQQNSAASAAAFSNMVKLAQQHTARQQLQQLQQKQQQQQQQQLPTLQPGGAAGAGIRLARLAPKPMPPLTNPQIGSQAPNFQPLLTNPMDNSNSSWLWKNFPDPNQYLLNGNGGGAASSASKLPHLTAKPATATSSGASVNKSAATMFTLKQQQQQMHQQKLIENAIMSKIPKSLTVIPQQLGGNTGGDLGGSSTPARIDDGERGRHGQEEQQWRVPGEAAGSISRRPAA